MKEFKMVPTGAVGDFVAGPEAAAALLSGETIRLVAENFDITADTSPLHITDSYGSFCGLRLERVTRGIDWQQADSVAFDPHLCCQQCFDARQCQRERDQG